MTYQHANFSLGHLDRNVSSTRVTDEGGGAQYILMFKVCLYTILYVGGCCGNIAILSIILRHKKMHTATNWLVFNLAFSDIAVAFITIPFTLITQYTKWPFGSVGCKYLIMPVVEHFAGACVLTHTAVGLARYTIVKNNREISNTSVLISICLIWSLSFFFLSGTLMGILGEFRLNEKHKCIISWYHFGSLKGSALYTYFVFPLTYLAPIVLTGFSYYRIRIISSRSLRRISHHLPQALFISRQRKNRRMNTILMKMYFMFAVTTLPFQTLLIFIHFDVLTENFKQKYGSILFHYLLALFYAQIITNPLVLFYMSIDYRRRIYDLPICCCIDVKNIRKLSLIVRQSMKEMGELKRKISAGRKISTARKISAARKISTARKISSSRYNTNRKTSRHVKISTVLSNRNHLLGDRKNSNILPRNDRKRSSNGEILNRMNRLNSICTDVRSITNSIATPTFRIPEEKEESWLSTESIYRRMEKTGEFDSEMKSQEYRKTSFRTFSNVNSRKINERKWSSNGNILTKMNQLNSILSNMNANRGRRTTSPEVANFNVLNINDKKWVSNGSILGKLNQKNNNNSDHQILSRVRKKAIVTNECKFIEENEVKRYEDNNEIVFNVNVQQQTDEEASNDDIKITPSKVIEEIIYTNLLPCLNVETIPYEKISNSLEGDLTNQHEACKSNTTETSQLCDSQECVNTLSDFDEYSDGNIIAYFYDPDLGPISFDHNNSQETDI